MVLKKSTAGGLLGIAGLALWAVSVFAEAPVYSNKYEFFLKMASSFSFNIYPLPLTFVFFAVAAFLGKRLSMIALAILAAIISSYHVYAGAYDIWNMILVCFSVIILLFSIFCGKGARI